MLELSGVPSSEDHEIERPFAVRVDGVLIDTYRTQIEALQEARSLKRDIPDSLVAVWDLHTERAEIIQG